MMSYEIHPDEDFPHLTKAPVVEAILEVRCTATSQWEPNALSATLDAALPNYPSSEDISFYRGEFRVDPLQGIKHHAEDQGWIGVRRTSTDGRCVVAFERYRFAFSRLAPYEGWEHFRKEGLRVWQIYRGLAQPTTIHRLGLRFINRLSTNAGTDPLALLDIPPRTPAGLDLDRSEFHHRDGFVVPSANLGVQVTRALIPSEQAGAEETARSLIIDVDVFTNSPLSVDNVDFENRLDALRFYKNKAFFGSISDTAKRALA